MSTTDNNRDDDMPPDICANCGKREDSRNNSLKTCTACKLVKYCSRECQIAHRPQHKKECKKRAKELHDIELFKHPPPQYEDCPICFLRMPSLMSGIIYMPCCGKNVCNACSLANGPSLSSSPTSSPQEDDGESEESTTTIATTSSSTIDDLWSNDTASVVIDLGGSTSEGLNDTNSSINSMNDTESTDDEESNNSTEQNIPTLAPQSSISANKELGQTNNTGTTQEKEGFSSGAKAGIAIIMVLLVGLGAAYFIHQRRKREDQASSDSLDDEEAGLVLADDDIDSATRDDVSTEGFRDTNNLMMPIEPPSPIRSVANSDDYIGVIVDE